MKLYHDNIKSIEVEKKSFKLVLSSILAHFIHPVSGKPTNGFFILFVLLSFAVLSYHGKL
ncbi:TPA: hypothetical protein ACF33U_004177 [Vibrio parahaemolyticus]